MKQEDFSQEVARLVMGWHRGDAANPDHWVDKTTPMWTPRSTSYWYTQWRRFDPLHSAENDLEVLCHIRESWPSSMLREFRISLLALWDRRIVVYNRKLLPAGLGGLDGCLFYERGDYSMTALKVSKKGIAETAGYPRRRKLNAQ